MNYGLTKESIKKGNLLKESDASYIETNIDNIQKNWEKRQVFRTETEMRISVLNDIKFPTPASKYWQCVREQAVFYENLVVLSFEYRRNKIEQLQIEDQLLAEYDELKKDLLQIDLEEKQFGQLNMEQTAKDRMREIKLWDILMREQVKAAKFDTEDVNIHQLVSYAHRFERQMQNIGNASPSEMSNLVGQYKTTMRVLEEQGLLTNQKEKIHALR